MILQYQQGLPAIRNLKPYVPGKPIDLIEREYGIKNAVKVASNENPYGPSPLVIKALSDFIKEEINISLYPDGSAWHLKQKLSKFYNFGTEYFTLGNGSNDILDLISRTFSGPGDEVIFSQYAFAVYYISTQSVGAKSVITPAVNYGYDLDAIIDSVSDKTKIIFIANPNNPTGTCLSAVDIASFLQQIPPHIIVVMDEAYAEYTAHMDSPWYQQYQSSLSLLSDYNNLIICRTFSKAYGLASLRIGYALSHPDIADLLNRVRHPFNNNSLALCAAEAALDDQDYMNECVKKNWQQMKYLSDEFSQLGLDRIPSAGNFICIDVKQDAAIIDQQLLKKGIITRPIANYGLAELLRISVGKDVENQKIIEAFKSIL